MRVVGLGCTCIDNTNLSENTAPLVHVLGKYQCTQH